MTESDWRRSNKRPELGTPAMDKYGERHLVEWCPRPSRSCVSRPKHAVYGSLTGPETRRQAERMV